MHLIDQDVAAMIHRSVKLVAITALVRSAQMLVAKQLSHCVSGFSLTRKKLGFPKHSPRFNIESDDATPRRRLLD
jgi:hypothetical protein